ncbi:MAG: glycosyltransferase family 4 protein, partial [Myxococcota bacterium]
MRLGVLTTGYPRFEGDVAGSFVEGMVRGLTARGHDVDVLAPASKDVARTGPVWVRYPKPPHWPETFYGAGVPDNTRDPRTWPGLVSYPFSLWRKARGRAREWDAVIGHFGVPCGWIAAQLGKPALVVWHSADVFLARKLPRRALRSLMRQHVHWFV